MSSDVKAYIHITCMKCDYVFVGVIESESFHIYVSVCVRCSVATVQWKKIINY